MLPTLGALRPWTDPTINSIGRLPAHVPLGGLERIVLDGTWRFELFEHPDDVPAEALNTDRPGSVEIGVPGNWTMQDTGPIVDVPQYTNVQMPFPGPPPRLPERIATGVYRRTVDIDPAWCEQRVVLHVGGAESVHAVYVGGEFVGYGTDSRLPSEYDITDRVVPGTNEIAIVVMRYSAHSYIEDQDQWWMAGLHRSVWLEARPSTHLADLPIDADFDPATGSGRIEARPVVAFTGGVAEGWTVHCAIIDPDQSPCGEVVTVAVETDHAGAEFVGFGAQAVWELPDAQPWSAERPARYTVTVELHDPDGNVVHTEVQHVGCRRVEVRDRQLLVNGAPVWIHGVNRHDHHPERGKAVTADDIRADLVAMRSHNITAVRTAHYPNDSVLYDLCDELGFYVIDEANIESHGNYSSVCRDDRYRAAWMERGGRMVTRDRNHPCVIIWSLGNESGYGPHHDALAAWIRRTDPSRPLHYEGAVRVAGWVDGGRNVTDLVAPMYPEIADIEAYGRDGLGDRPLIMCEYSHAMGNSNGSLADYWETIHTTPGLQGGFIWEWKDHGLRAHGDPSGPLLYGGQFGDTPNDGNFVADGLMSADLVPHPAMAEVAWVYRPVAVTLHGDLLRVENRQSFTGLDDLAAECELVVDGIGAGVVKLAVGTVEPHGSADVAIPADLAADARAAEGDVSLTVRWHTTQSTWWAGAGHLVAWDQLDLTRVDRQPPAVIDDGDTDVTVPVRPQLHLWRAATDNDGFKLMPDFSKQHDVGGEALWRWLDWGVDRLDPGEIVGHTMSIDRPVVHDDGTVAVTFSHQVVVPDDRADLPRIGVGFVLPSEYRVVRFVGRGPHENYPDRRRGAAIGEWDTVVEECPYLLPQEYGLRTDCYRMELSGTSAGERVIIEALAASGPGIDGSTLHMGATTHSAAELYAAPSIYDLAESTGVHVAIDVAHRGIGTASCGPDVLPAYRIQPGTYRFTYRITSPATL